MLVLQYLTPKGSTFITSADNMGFEAELFNNKATYNRSSEKNVS